MLLDEIFRAIRNVDCGHAHCALPALKQYVEWGGDLNALHPESGWGILHSAAEHHNHSIIEAMAEYGADLNIRSAERCPAIFQALDVDIDGAIQTSRLQTFETTILFLKLGADGDLEDQDGKSLSQFASEYGPEILNRFESLVGPLLKQQDPAHNNALHRSGGQSPI